LVVTGGLIPDLALRLGAPWDGLQRRKLLSIWHSVQRVETQRPNLEGAHAVAREINGRGVEEVGADKGYHSGAVLQEMQEQEVRSYLPELERGRRNWPGEGKAEEQKRTYQNRRGVRADRNQRLQKLWNGATAVSNSPRCWRT